MKNNQSGEDKQKDPGNGPAENKTTGEASRPEDLEAQLGEIKREAAENYDKYLRSVAELDNYRKRAARERADYIKYANENILRDLLPILDNMERAREHASGGGEIAPFLEGLDLIQAQFRDILSRYGVEVIEALGREFDPNFHEAVMQVPGDAETDNKVVEEFARGYLLNGRLLRPAKVSVAISKKE